MRSERFTPSSFDPETGRSLEQELNAPESRRGKLFAFLGEAAKDPRVLIDGMDVARLNAEVSAAEAGDTEFSDDARGPDVFKTTFHPDMRYAPLSAIERADEAALSPELRELRDFMPFLREYLRAKGKVHGIDLHAPESDRIIIGFAQREGVTDAPIVGGFHAGLNEQGYKFYDGTLQENIRLDAEESPEYRMADMLRSVAHDTVHASQYKLFGSSGTRVAFLGRKLDRRRQEGAEAWEVRALEDQLGLARYNEAASAAELRQYGLAMPANDHAIEIDGRQIPFSLGAMLFEYATDKIALEAVSAYLAREGKELPEPSTEIERLSRLDLAGKRIRREDVHWDALDGNGKRAAEEMVSFGDTMHAPAERILDLLGPLREPVLEAMAEAGFTGKFRKMKALRSRMDALAPEAKEALKGYAEKGAVFLRPLFTREQE